MPGSRASADAKNVSAPLFQEVMAPPLVTVMMASMGGVVNRPQFRRVLAQLRQHFVEGIHQTAQLILPGLLGA